MRREYLSRTVAVSAAVLFLTTPSTVYAAYVSIHGGGSIVTMVGDVAADTLTITQVGGLFRHNRFTAGDPGFASDFDFDTINAGDQTLPSATGIINIFAGDGNDTITIGDGINLRGLIDGQVGTDTLDYSAFTTAVRANLGLGTAGLGATLGADQENPPTTHTATATATVSNYSVTARTFDITVTVTGLLPADVTGFHIHQGAVGVNGPIIVDFTGVAPLLPAGTGFTFTATGLVLPAASEAALLGGGTYVNIHTAAFPGGAIRGQLFSAGNVNLATGVATGTNSIQNMENVTGGVGNDSLVGSSAINTINGGAGADWIVGGPGNDVLNGGAGADVLVWSNGDGSDLDEGGADIDTVQVNGSTAAADIFLVSPNGVRLRFDRTNLGLFNLDVGTVETLTVNGIGGDDAFTVNNLTGVTSLATINLYGFEGNDGFTFVPTTAGALVFNAHGGPGTDTLQGPNFASTWNLTGANQGNIAGLVTTFSFIETLAGGSGSDTFNVKAFATGTPTTVTGGAGTDTLNYDAESRGVSGDTTPPDGVIDSPGVQSVTFATIEGVNITNPQPAIAITDVTVAEPGSPTNAVFNVTLTNASALTVTVNFATANGTATAPGDYMSQTGTLTFAPGETAKTIPVPINQDTLSESAETFVVNLSGAANAAIADAQGVGTITDTAAPAMALDKTSLIFGAISDGTGFGARTSAQAVLLTQSGTGTVTWTAVSTAPWLVVSPESGTGSATLLLSTQFAPGLTATQTASVIFTFTGASNTAGPITVTLNTIPTGAAPFGAFDTPLDGTAGLSGSIAVTGWALDDIEVTGVRILRDPVAGEPEGALVFIGNAVLIDGARPDVQALFPSTPRNSRAGWGYLMLTNFLPDLGNGTFRLTAIADDADGHATIVGTKTITCANSTATTPFGAIDTPTLGGTVSGTVVNFGWVLSPAPRRADPPGGGSVQVVVDGAFLGSAPSGWTSRSDLTALFPASQYPGIGTALGVAAFDSTGLANGVHTIAWVVTDNLGSASGIGSRYFTVSNGSSLLLDPAQASASLNATDTIETISGLPPVREGLSGRRGFDLNAPYRTYPAGEDGRVTVVAEELDRIELQPAGGEGNLTGYLRVAGALAPLPIGSTLNASTGTFTWAPGVGFLGTYDLVFVRQAGGRAIARQDVRIVLKPKGSDRPGPQTVIDVPAVGSAEIVVGQSFVLAGWAADLGSAVDRGVATVHVWAYPVTGDDPIWIGEANYGASRPDVAAVYGDRFRSTGYGITVRGLATGTYDLAVFAYSTVTQGFVPAKTVRVTVR